MRFCADLCKLLSYLLFYGDEPSQPAFRLKTSPAVGCACLRAYEESIDKHESGAIPNSCRWNDG